MQKNTTSPSPSIPAAPPPAALTSAPKASAGSGNTTRPTSRASKNISPSSKPSSPAETCTTSPPALSLHESQKFTAADIHRKEITGAPYNPRRISEKERTALKKIIGHHGLVEPLVWNKRTGTLVSGHQRLGILDQLAKSKNYLLTVSVIDVDEKTEKS